MDLREFLTACLDEDERVAKAATTDPWESCGDGRIEAFGGGNDFSMVIYDEGGHTDRDAAHIVAWQPARVLAEIAAKRAILRAWPDPFGNATADQVQLASAVKYRVLLHLAQPYRDRDGWQAEWSTETVGPSS